MKIILTAPSVVVDKRNDKGETPLYLALVQGNVDVVRALLEAKANPNDLIANEPLIHHAVAAESPELVSLLIEVRVASSSLSWRQSYLVLQFKADVNKVAPGTGSTALHKVALTGCLPQLATLLIRAGANVHSFAQPPIPYSLSSPSGSG